MSSIDFKDNDSRNAHKDPFYPQGQPSPAYAPIKTMVLRLIIILIIIVPLLGLYLVCMVTVSSVESFYFTFDSEAELDDELLNETYYNLDADSRVNVTNETYFLVLSIPDLNYSIRFDYLFEFTADNITNLRIEQHRAVPKITDFEHRPRWNPYNLSIEFRINSTDPDILNVTIFPPENIIDGELFEVGIDYMYLSIRLDEGEVLHNFPQPERMILPNNQIIILIVDNGHPCPFY